MRKMMTKEVIFTTIYSGKIVVNPETKMPVVEPIEPMEVMGTISQSKASKRLYKKYGAGITIYNMEEKSVVYEMEVEEFIKHATLKIDGEEENTDEIEEDDEEEETPKTEERKARVRRITKEMEGVSNE